MKSEIGKFAKKAFGITKSECAERRICPFCHKAIGKFRNELSFKEYRISGLCQKCQDATFGKD